MQKKYKIYFNKEIVNICLFFVILFSFFFIHFVKKGNFSVSFGFGIMIFFLLWFIYHIITQKSPPTQRKHNYQKTIFKPEHEYKDNN